MTNTEKFTDKADLYARYRPSYPRALYDYLYESVGFSSGSAIADVGSGTGLFARGLLERGSTVYGVEPNSDMRGRGEILLSAFLRFSSVNGSAEDTALAASSLDFVTVAQAFHWFDRIAFQAECRRILKPGGKVVLAWNNYDIGVPVIEALECLKRELCPGFGGFSREEDFDPARLADFFKGGRCEYRTFENNQELVEEAFVGASLSASYAPKPGSDNYEVFLEGLRKIFGKYSTNGIVAKPIRTRSYIGEV